MNDVERMAMGMTSSEDLKSGDVRPPSLERLEHLVEAARLEANALAVSKEPNARRTLCVLCIAKDLAEVLVNISDLRDSRVG